MSIKLVLRCDSITPEGSSFTPLARWQDENSKWLTIEGFIVPISYHKKYEVKSLILAEVEEHNNSQIKKDFVPKLFYELLLEQELDEKNPSERLVVQSQNNWDGKRVYFGNENFVVGSYQIKNEGNVWVAYAELAQEKYLNRYKFEDVIASDYLFEDSELGLYFLPQEIKSSPASIIISDFTLFKQILEKLSDSSKLSEQCKQEIRTYVEENRGEINLLQKHFHGNAEELIEKFHNALENIESNQELLDRAVQILKEHPVIKNEIEKYKQDKIKQELEGKKQAIKQKLEKEEQELRRKSEEKKQKIKETSEKEIHGIENKVRKKREEVNRLNEERNHLEGLKKQMKKEFRELAGYIRDGEKWRNALYPSSENKFNFYSEENEILILSEWDDNYWNIHDYSFFEKFLRQKNVTDDNILKINQMINQFREKRVYSINKIEDLAEIESFFEAIGHKKARFILNADASWLTPESLWQTKGYLSDHDKLITLPDLFKIAEKNEMFVFQVEILGADRAPIEGYFGPLLKAMERKESVVAQDVLMNIPDNIFFFLQLDQDEYTAKPSDWLKNKLDSIQLPSVRDIPKNIAIPFNVMERMNK